MPPPVRRGFSFLSGVSYLADCLTVGVPSKAQLNRPVQRGRGVAPVCAPRPHTTRRKPMLELLIGTGWTLAAGFIGYAIASARYRARIRTIETNLYYLQRYMDDSRKRLERKRAEIRERYNNA